MLATLIALVALGVAAAAWYEGRQLRDLINKRWLLDTALVQQFYVDAGGIVRKREVK